MMKKCFTVETRLDTSKIPIDYFIWSIQKSSRLFRIVWKLIQTSKLTTYQLSSHLQKTYIIDKRSADSLIINAKARLSSIKKQKTHEMNLLYQKLIFLRNKIKEYHNAIKPLKTKATNNTISKTDLQQYRILKYKIWQTKQQFNRIKQKHQQYQKLIHCNYYPICFGTKKSFRSQYYLKENGFKSHQGWLNTFRQKRDSQIYFVGSRSDRYGNQNCQLTYDSISDKFSLRIRKDIEFPSSNEPFIVINNLDFKYQKEKLIQTIYEQQTPFTFRIIRRRNKWYIQVIFTWLENEESYIHSTVYGTIGLDYNVGFISMSETDYHGNLVDLKHFPLPHHGQGNKADSELQETVAKIVKIAIAKEKPIVIENLDFQHKKTQITKTYHKKGKIYNRIIHSFNYSRYKDSLDNACFRHKIKLILINPANTTQIGIKKYSHRMKLNSHQAASYVIARRGQNYID